SRATGGVDPGCSSSRTRPALIAGARRSTAGCGQATPSAGFARRVQRWRSPEALGCVCGCLSARLHHFGVPLSTIRKYPSLEEWTDWYEDDHCERVAPLLRDALAVLHTRESELAPIMVRGTRGDYLVVDALERDDAQFCLKRIRFCWAITVVCRHT